MINLLDAGRWAVFALLLPVILFPCGVHQLAQLGTLGRDPWPDFTCARIYIMLEYWTMGLLHYQLPGKYHVGTGLSVYALVMGVYAGFGTSAHTIHHDFTGLLVMLAPLYSWQLVGLAYIVDSITYTLHEPIGLDNVVVAHYLVVLLWLAVTGLVEVGVRCCRSSTHSSYNLLGQSDCDDQNDK
jgi:hypothetical protein